MVEYYEARVLFDYTPETCDELRLRQGEPVEVRIDHYHPDDTEEGWLSGTDLRGHHGIFPSTYVVDVRTAAVDTHQSRGHDSHTTSANNTAVPNEQHREQEVIVGRGKLRLQRDVEATRVLETLPAVSIAPTGLAPDPTVDVQDHTAALDTYSRRDPNSKRVNLPDLPGEGTSEVAHGASNHVLNTAAPPEGSHRSGGRDTLPEGWFSGVDEDTGAVYYYTEDGQSAWVGSDVDIETTTALRSGGDQTIQMVANLSDRAEDCDADSESREDRQAREHAAIRIQAISRGKHARRNNVARQRQQIERQLPATHRRKQNTTTTRGPRPRAMGQRRPDVDGEYWGGGGAVAGGKGEGSRAPGGPPVAGASEGPKTDKQIAQLIASLVDERLMEKLHQRDNILSEIQATVSTLAHQGETIAGSSSMPTTTRPPASGRQEPDSPPRLRRVAPQSSEPTSAPIAAGRRSNKGATITAVGVRAGDLNPLNNPNTKVALRNFPGRASPRRAGGSPRHGNAQDLGHSSRPSARSIGVSYPGERSQSPPSRSQPLRALAHNDVDSSVSPAYWGADDDDYSAPGFGAEDDGTTHDIFRGARGGRGGVSADVPGVLPQAMPPLPRVADLEGAHRLALAKLREKEAEAAALVKPTAPRHHGGRTIATALYHPSRYDPASADTSLPESELALEYVHGYAGETPGSAGPGGGAVGGGGFGGGGEQVKGRVGGARQAATRSTNIMWLRTGEVVFPASAVVVIHDFEANRQRFFTGHDEEVTALAVHPFDDIVVSGQAGKEAIVCLFDASRRPEAVGNRNPEARPAAGSAKFDEGVETADEATQTTTFLRELSLGKKEKRGVAALDFSSDGNLILAMAGGDGQALSVWDWRRGVRLATARAEAAFLPAYSVRFNPWLFLEGTRAEAAGMSPGDACYTLVSCGQRHVRFWTLTRDRSPYPGGSEGDGGEGRRGWVWTLSSRRGSFDKRGDIDNMTCMAFIGKPLVGGRRRGDGLVRLPVARVVTGADSGQIYFWEVIEEGQVAPTGSSGVGGGGQRVGWKPHGRLLAVVPKAHDGALTDMCYLPHDEDRVPVGKRRPDGASVARVCSEREDWGRLATCGGEGTLRLWGVTGAGPSPLQLLLTVEVSKRGIGIGHARSISWDRSGTTLALGTVGNAVCLVQPGEDIDGTRARTENRSDGQGGTGSVLFMLAVQGHTGMCKALAPHPTRPWFVTGGTDRVLRLWDAHSRRQLSAARLLERVSSAVFHPAGDVLAVGNEAGDFFLMALRAPSSLTATGPEQSGQLPATTTTATAGRRDVANTAAGFVWEVLARKRIVPGAGVPVATSTTGASRPAARAEHPSPGTDSSHHRDEAYPRRSTDGEIGNDGRSLSLGAARRRQGDRGRRRSKPTSAGGGKGHGGGGHADRYHSNSTGRTRGGSVDSFSSSPSRLSVGTEALVVAAGGVRVSPLPTMTATMDVPCLRFSPGGDVLAAACGSAIHLYREAGRGAAGGGGFGVYRRYGVCTGHGTIVKCLDFSRDGSTMQSNDASGELLFWEVATGRQITNSFSVRDLEMDTWSCPVGWPSQGLRTVASGGGGAGGGGGGASNIGGSHSTGGVVAVCRSNAGDVLVMSDEDNCVNLVRNPAPEGVKARANWGHTTASRVSGLAFLCDDRRLVSAGGTCAFVWRQVRRPALHHRQDEGETAAARTPATAAEESSSGSTIAAVGKGERHHEHTA